MTHETRTIRVPADLAEMLAAIQRCGRGNVAEIVDPILRKPIERLFDKLPELDQQYARERIVRLTQQPAPAAK